MPSIIKRCFNAFVDCCKHNSNVKRLIYFGEPLENDIRKYLLEKHAIECFSLYGSTDDGWLAAECDAHDGMHLFADSALLHLFPEANSTELVEDGTALFTSLFQTGKPNLRYSNGDKLRINRHACSCGRTTPKVYVTRRDTDIFALLGMKISIKEVQHVIYEKEEVSCYFQIELLQKEEKTFFIVRLPNHLEVAAERITEGLENKIGLAFYTCLDLVKIKLEYVANDYFTTRKIPALIDNRGSLS
jgi:phenylacetate-CoA ligase